MKKTRVDVALVERGLAASREEAQRAVMAGSVKIGEQIAAKSSTLVSAESELSVAARPQFVSRGGLKLAGALDDFAVDVAGVIALDIGASTGGFTDCLLQRGAAKVYAIDVGHGQLAWKIRDDPRVVVREKLNARILSRDDVPEAVALCVIDVSFISLTLILPAAFPLLAANGMLLALIKPQFELARSDVARGGIVSDPALHEKAVAKVRDFVANELHREVLGVKPSHIRGTDGNQEFFLCARNASA